jgi:hypothetical protein
VNSFIGCALLGFLVFFPSLLCGLQGFGVELGFRCNLFLELLEIGGRHQLVGGAFCVVRDLDEQGLLGSSGRFLVSSGFDKLGKREPCKQSKCDVFHNAS